MYIISGGYDSKGTYDDDSSDLNKYYELGWEVVVSNVYIKSLLDENKISKDDVIVTKKDRKFIYSSVFTNVIDWDTFKLKNISSDEIIKIDYSNILETFNFSKINKELICNFNLNKNIEEKYNINGNFICYCLRLRKHCEYRNSSVDVAKSVIKKLVDDFGIKVFVVGNDAEFLCDGDNVINVGLQDFASLINSKYCKSCISKLSGIIHLANFCGHEDLVNIIYDPTGDRTNAGQHPLYMSDETNYRNTTNIFIERPESHDLTIEMITDYVNF